MVSPRKLMLPLPIITNLLLLLPEFGLVVLTVLKLSI